MNTLILDCSCGMNVYLVANGKTYSKTDETKNKHTDNLLLVVDQLLFDAGITVKDLDNICVSVGPGSFTGIRVAISIAKGLAVGSGAKVFTLSNFENFNKNNENCFCVLEGFSNYIYVRSILNGKINDKCLTVDDFKNITNLKDSKIYVLSEKTQSYLKNLEIKPILCENQIILRFMEEIKNNKQIKLNQIMPVYLRASQAEIEREKKQNG